MAITVGSQVDAVADTATSITSPSIDASSGSNQCLVACTGSSSITEQNPTSVTWDVASPQTFTVAQNLTSQAFFGSSIRYLLSPTQATDTVTANYSGTGDSLVLSVLELEGVDQTTPTGSTAIADDGATSTSPLTATVLSPESDSLIIDSFVLDDTSGTITSMSAGANQTEYTNRLSGGVYPAYHGVSTQSGADGGAMSWSWVGTAGQSVMTAVEFEAAAGAAGATIPIFRHHRVMQGGA